MGICVSSPALAVLELLEDPAEQFVVLEPDLSVVAERQVDEKLAEVLGLLLELVVFQEHQILEDDGVHDGAQVHQLLFEFFLVQMRELVGRVLRRLRHLTCLLAGVDGDQLAVLEHIVLQDFGAEREERPAHGVIVVRAA